MIKLQVGTECGKELQAANIELCPGSGILLSVPLLVVDATRMRVLVATRMRVLYLTLMRVIDVTLMKVLHITFMKSVFCMRKIPLNIVKTIHIPLHHCKNSNSNIS